MKDYELSAGAIRYVAAAAGAMRFTGIPDVTGMLDEAGRRKAQADAEEELEKAGLLTMDFDGKRTVDTELLERVRLCGNVSHIAGFDMKRPDGERESCTVYLDRNEAYHLLQRQTGKENMFRFGDREKNEILATLKEMTAFPANATAEEATLETADLSQPEKEVLVAHGCPEKTAELICSAINGGGHSLSMHRVTNTVEDLTYVLIWNEGMLLRMHVAYEDDQEIMHFTPVKAEEAYGFAEEVLCRAVFTADEAQDENISSSQEPR